MSRKFLVLTAYTGSVLRPPQSVSVRRHVQRQLQLGRLRPRSYVAVHLHWRP
jgi:hypothetical protein